ncbi:unnamed protein product, partial [Rotaria sp. Silwood1]
PLQQEQIRPTNNNGVPKCNCNVDAKELTVRKEGPNKGRSFFRCGNNDQCNFFAWKDDAISSFGGGIAPRQYGDNHSNVENKRRKSDNDEDSKQ